MNIALKDSGLDGQLICTRISEYEELLGEKAIKQKLLIMKVCEIGFKVLVLSLIVAVGAAAFTANYLPVLAISGILLTCCLATQILKPFTGFKEFNSYITLKEIKDNWNTSLGLRKIKMLINEFKNYIRKHNEVVSTPNVSQIKRGVKVIFLKNTSVGDGVAQFLRVTIVNSLAMFKFLKVTLQQNLQQG